jgi:hypothetical protein
VRAGGLLFLVCLVLVIAPSATADGTPAAPGWLPHAADATWTYQFTDSLYNTAGTTEHVSVVKASGSDFTLGWTIDGGPNANGCQYGQTSNGWVAFSQTNGGIFNGADGWCGNPPPPQFPILCATAGGCPNVLSTTLYNLIWGSRTPILAEPVLRGATWSATGGAQGDVASANDYAGTEQITVPAFPQPVLAAKVRSQITQAGALGDPYGSGVRTVWWVYGVGPVKVELDHSGGAVTTAVLQSTNQTPAAPPPDANYFPLTLGLKGKFSWTNSKYMKKPEIQSYSIDQVANGSAQVTVTSVSGPIKVLKSAYAFTARLDGVTNLLGVTQAQSLAKPPPLGPRSLPVNERRHFFTPFDLMTYGFNPVITAYPAAGNTWTAATSGRDYQLYGVTGTTTVLGVQTVKVPGGTFKALAVRSVLKQQGFPFGSGTRTSWFAPGRGLVKLVFKHDDGSVSTVQLIH